MPISLCEGMERRIAAPGRVGICALAEELLEGVGIGITAGLPQRLGGHPPIVGMLYANSVAAPRVP